MRHAVSLIAGLVSATTAFGSSLDRKVPEPTSLEAFVAIPRPQPDVELTYGPAHAFSRFVPVLCGPGILDTLAPTADAYAEISPAALPPAKAQITMISGILDRLVPPYVAHDYAHDYARAMRRKRGPDIDLVDVPGAGHFDRVTPGTPAWGEVILRITAALGIHERDPAPE